MPLTADYIHKSSVVAKFKYNIFDDCLINNKLTYWYAFLIIYDKSVYGIFFFQ